MNYIFELIHHFWWLIGAVVLFYKIYKRSDISSEINPTLLKMGVMFTAIGITVTGMKSGNMTPQEAVSMIGQNSQPLIFSLFLQLLLSNLPLYKSEESTEEFDVREFVGRIRSIDVILGDISRQNAEIFNDIAKNNSDAMIESMRHLMNTIADKVNNEIKDTVSELNISCKQMIETTNKFGDNVGSYNQIISSINRNLENLNGIVASTTTNIDHINSSAKEIAVSSSKMNGAFNAISNASSGVVSAARQISESTSLMQKDANDYIRKIEEISREHMKKYGNVNSQLIDNIYKSIQSNTNRAS